jgi:hypothetical protein
LSVAGIVENGRFPEGAMIRRLRTSVETTLGKRPALLLVPTAGAFVGTAWSVGHPSEIIKHGL